MSESQQQKQKKIKIGIDVGGTFTHAVAMNLETMELVGKAVVPTTHSAKEGVAAGVVESMRKLLAEAHLDPDEVSLIAHSTTQATNALVEGDVAKVGIIGMSSGAGAIRARMEMNPGKIELSSGKFLQTVFRFVDTEKEYSEDKIREIIREMHEGEGCQAIVATESFGVDKPERENRVVAIAQEEFGLPACASSGLSQLYGLRVRTRTAVINASMLPKMLETANMTEKAVRESGISVPLMVMRSDGGIMDIEAMRKRPILTMLSGPAAGVAAALMYERISDGSMVEVGGTTSDICVIKNGRPIVTQGEVGGHKLFVRTLDVRTLGIAGGSVPRLRGNKLVDVGPRSAHIAGLGYEAFTDNIEQVEVTTVQPREGDPDDYLALRINGEEKPSLTLTPTGASNILGLVEGYAKGNMESTRKCFEAVAEHCRTSVESLADTLLNIATKKVQAIVKRMLDEHKLQARKITLVGGGGGAEAVVPYTAKRMKMDYRIARNNEVISAIGVALGIIQDTVERTVINPSENDIIQVRREALESVQAMGAAPETIEVMVEVDRQTKRVTATARGTPELRTRALGGALPSDEELIAKAADHMALESSHVKQVKENGWMRVFQGEDERSVLFGLLTTLWTPVIVVDREGIVRLQLTDARVDIASPDQVEGMLGEIIEQFTTFGDAGEVLPEVYVVKPGQITDLSGLVEPRQIMSVARVEMQSLMPDDKVAILSSRRY